MADFRFIQNPISKKWVISAPRRAKRPDVARGPEPLCPFCPGREKDEPEAFRIGGQKGDSNWQVRVIPNKFPFASIHEVVIHSPDHHKNFDELPIRQVELIIKTYQNRFLEHKTKGQVYIFNNHGREAGESLPHPHTQIAIVPSQVTLDLPRLEEPQNGILETEKFIIFCPLTSQWPDETWVFPKKRGRGFFEIDDVEIGDFATVLQRLIQIFTTRHGHEFPYNFYIYPGGDWYLRLIPRVKIIGGFELGTGIFVNTQDPKEALAFLKTHFYKPDHEKIKTHHKAEYVKAV